MWNNMGKSKLDGLELSSRQKYILVNLSGDERAKLFSILEKEKEEERVKDEKKYEKLEECRQKIPQLLDESRKYIDDEKWEMWEEDNSIHGDSYDVLVYDMLECELKILRLLENGISPDIIVEEVEKGVSEEKTFIYACRKVIRYSKYWKEFEKAVKKRDRKEHRKLRWELLKDDIRGWLK